MKKSVELKAELLGIFSLLNYIAYGQKNHVWNCKED